jgi:hypothetical protein
MSTTSEIRTLTIPVLRGKHYDAGNHDGRYRLWTHADGLDFHALPAYEDGGPAMVVIDGWCTSTMSPTDDPDLPHEFSAHRGITTDSAEYHPLHGTRYATRQESDWAAYDAGLLGFYVKESDHTRYGLPTEDR